MEFTKKFYNIFKSRFERVIPLFSKATTEEAKFRVAEKIVRYIRGNIRDESKFSALSDLMDIVRADAYKQIRGTNELQELLEPYAGSDQEHIIMVFLDTKLNMIGDPQVLNVGNADRALMDIKKLCRTVVERNASSVIFVHNHPSGSLEPSMEDIRLKFKLKDALKMFDCELIDAVIISRKGVTSFLNDEY